MEKDFTHFVKTGKYPVIDVPADGESRWMGGAYCLCFVYSKHHGNFILRGYHREVEEYLKKHYTHYFCNFSLWCDGQHRDIWHFWKESIGLFTPSKVWERWKFEVRPYFGGYRGISHEESKKQSLQFKRLPKRWIPEFDNF